MLWQLYIDHRLSGVELALMDVDRAVLDLMADLARRLADEAGVATRITTHTDACSAVDGCHFVICCAAVQGLRRFQTDCRIIARHCPGHLLTEFGGIAGISYSLRQIALIQRIAADIRSGCPDAWLLNVSNPLPRVCQAAEESGVRTVGFCSGSLSGIGMLSRLLTGRPVGYPFVVDGWDVTLAGLNHFSWLIRLRDRATGADLLPELRRRLAEGATSGNPVCEDLARRTGYLLTPCDDHVRDFLPPGPNSQPLKTAFHGSPDQRRDRLAMLRAIADGQAPVKSLSGGGSWERPIDFVAALTGGPPANFHALNLPNRGQTPQLPRGIFVETPCQVGPAGPTPRTVDLPEPVLDYCRPTAAVHDAIVRSAMQRKRRLVHEAVELAPTILDKPSGLRAIDECLAAHADILPAYE